MLSSEVNTDRTVCKVRTRPIARPDTSRLDSQAEATAHCQCGLSATGSQKSARGDPRERGEAPLDERWSFDRSGGRALAKKITDGLLIDIQEAVNGAADAATPILSGLGRKRLMAWVVIDVVRSPVVLDRTAADKAGGRIWLQAQRVSAARIAIADGAAKECAAARAAAAADPNLEAGLATKLAAVDAAEKLKVSEQRGEVYIGFHELEIASPPQLPLVSGAGTDEASLGLHAATRTSSSSSGIGYPYLVPTTRTPEEAPAIPADLRGKLGVDGNV